MRRLRWLFPLLIFVLSCARSPWLLEEENVEKDIEWGVKKLIDEIIETNKRQGEELNLSVLGFVESKSGLRFGLSSLLEDELISKLITTGKFGVVERERLNLAMKELALQLTGVVDEQQMRRAGRAAGADAILTGSYHIWKDEVIVFARLIDVERGENIATGKVRIFKRGIPPEYFIEEGLKDEREILLPPLQLEMMLVGERKIDGRWEEVIIEEGATLKSHDHFKVYFETNEDCYVYVLIYDSLGEVKLLFPAPKTSMDNHVKGGISYSVPPGDLWFFLDENTGIETIFVLASYEKMEDIGKLIQEMEGVSKEEKKDYSDKVIEVIEKIGNLVRGVKKKTEPIKPIDITGAIGDRMEMIELVTRGIGGITPGKVKKYKLSDGRQVQRVTEVVKGYISAIRVISFRHVK